MIVRLIRSAFLALVLASLVASAAFAAPRAVRPAPVPASGLAAIWEWAVSVFTPALPVSQSPGGGIMEKAGSIMDPNGDPHAGSFSVGSTTDAGSQMDPNGFE
jgi:hypothetical protein